MNFRLPPRPACRSMRLSVLMILMTAVGGAWNVSGAANAAPPKSILFIGNSFTYAHGSALRFIVRTPSPI